MSEERLEPERSSYASVTLWSLLALAGGLALGFAGHLTEFAPLTALGPVGTAIGDVWVAALQMITLPLALVLTLAATANASSKTVGALGVRSLAFYMVALALAACFAVFAGRALLAYYTVDQGMIASLPPTALPTAADQAQPSAAAWFSGLIPRNIFAAAARGDVFPLLLFVIVLGLAIAQLPAEHRQPLTRGAQALSQAMLVLVRWVLVVTPIGVFALTFVIALNTGASWAGILGVYLLLRIGVTLLAVLLLYPISVLFGRTPLLAFAKAVFPAQIVAVSTRSSLASLPAMVAGGRQHMGLSGTATDFVLPLSVSLFRIGTAIANPIKMVFLAHVYGIAIAPVTVALFVATEIVFTLSATGTPNSGGGSSFRMVPVFLAAGIPIEGLVLLEAVETIPDIAETLANVTGQMSATTILTRSHAAAAIEGAGATTSAES